MFLACLHVGVHGGLVQMTTILRNQQSCLLSQNFGKRIAKDPFRCPIREQDDAIVIDADDGVRRGLCNDAEQLAGFVGCAVAFHRWQVPRIRNGLLMLPTSRERRARYLLRALSRWKFLNWSAV